MYPCFSKLIHTDSRVSAVLQDCTKCGTKLPVAQVVGSGPMMLFAQCAHCKTVFIMDIASFDASVSE